MLIDELHKKKEAIYAIAHKYGAQDVRVFGSVARQEETIDSDIDILISLPHGYDMFKQRLPLQEELSLLLQKNVDLVILHELNRYIKDDILRNCQEI